jgi:hypothetical protein
LVLLGRDTEAAADLSLFTELLPDRREYLDSVPDLARPWRRTGLEEVVAVAYRCCRN